jgi:hypothetical protein
MLNTVRVRYSIEVEIPNDTLALEALFFVREVKQALHFHGWPGSIRSRLVGVYATQDRHSKG